MVSWCAQRAIRCSIGKCMSERWKWQRKMHAKQQDKIKINDVEWTRRNDILLIDRLRWTFLFYFHKSNLVGRFIDEESISFSLGRKSVYNRFSPHRFDSIRSTIRFTRHNAFPLCVRKVCSGNGENWLLWNAQSFIKRNDEKVSDTPTVRCVQVKCVVNVCTLCGNVNRLMKQCVRSNAFWGQFHLFQNKVDKKLFFFFSCASFAFFLTIYADKWRFFSSFCLFLDFLCNTFADSYT